MQVGILPVSLLSWVSVCKSILTIRRVLVSVQGFKTTVRLSAVWSGPEPTFVVAYTVSLFDATGSS